MISFRSYRRGSSAPTYEIPGRKDRFGRQKVSLNRNGCRNGRKNGDPVTTRHLFWPNQRRKTALLLPSWLRNLAVLVWTRQLPPGGRSAAQTQPEASTQKGSRNFLPKDSLSGTPRKKCAGAAGAHSKQANFWCCIVAFTPFYEHQSLC